MASRGARDLATGLSFILPNFLGFAVFTAGPLLFSLIVAFSNWNLLGTVPFAWNGLENFTILLRDDAFWHALVNTLYLMLGLPFAVGGALCLALMLNGRIRGVAFFRTLYYLPTFTAGVALMILWKALLNPEFGPINQLLGGIANIVGWEPFSAPAWLVSTKNLLALSVERIGLDPSQFGLGAREGLILMGIWTAIGGNNMILYIAALQNVPADLYEAAKMDGAGRWAIFRHVIWPQIMPTTFFIVIMSCIGGLQGGFEAARVMTGGGPAGTTKTLAYFIYEEAFMRFQIGYASAAAWVLFVLIFGFTIAYWRVGNKAIND